MKTKHWAQHKGDLYLKARYAGMHPLTILLDGIPVTCFGKTPYLKVKDAIKWHEDEIKSTEGRWPRKTMDLLLQAQRAFESGAVVSP